ncbi:hypothetical protein HY025_05880 [Candidatus Daviesbacteria bacterium]|nr:hypothetical protein [Candidatus Daviesbacteria bacterium]
MKTKQLIFFAIFSVLGFITLQIPFTKLAGSNVSFTLFDFFGPISGAFLGSAFGVLSVLGIEIINLLIKHTSLTTGVLIRLFPVLFALLYFSLIQKKNNYSKLILLVPILAILAFWANPVGKQVWYFALFWTIPLIAYFKRNNLLIKSLGSTFTAHSVGGAAWIWAFNLPASIWQGLIPVVIEERTLFALGIAGSYLVMKQLLNFLTHKNLLPKSFLPA